MNKGFMNLGRYASLLLASFALSSCAGDGEHGANKATVSCSSGRSNNLKPMAGKVGSVVSVKAVENSQEEYKNTYVVAEMAKDEKDPDRTRFHAYLSGHNDTCYLLKDRQPVNPKKSPWYVHFHVDKPHTPPKTYKLGKVTEGHTYHIYLKYRPK